MPGRKVPLVTGETYHVFNRGVASQPIFLDKRDYQRAIETAFFYQNIKTPLRYSFFIRLTKDRRLEILEKLRKEKNFFVDIIAYCFMPNHIHLLLKQLKDLGISAYMSNLCNSYTRYFNTKKKRTGPIFQGKFNAVRIETDDQLLHVQRYIHLNPYSSYVVKNLRELESYPYSSLPEYLGLTREEHCSKEMVLGGHFKDIKAYKEFLFNQADYQRSLERIKHLIFEN